MKTLLIALALNLTACGAAEQAASNLNATPATGPAVTTATSTAPATATAPTTNVTVNSAGPTTVNVDGQEDADYRAMVKANADNAPKPAGISTPPPGPVAGAHPPILSEKLVTWSEALANTPDEYMVATPAEAAAYGDTQSNPSADVVWTNEAHDVGEAIYVTMTDGGAHVANAETKFMVLYVSAEAVDHKPGEQVITAAQYEETEDAAPTDAGAK